MSIATQIQAIKTSLTNIYTALTNKGATIPQNKNLSNVANAITSISGSIAPSPTDSIYCKIAVSNMGWDPMEDLNEILTPITLSDGANIFYGLHGISSFPTITFTDSATSMEAMFTDCNAMVTAPQITNTSNIQYFSNTFVDCASLENVPVYDTASALDMSLMFQNCKALTETSLNNILLMCANATGVQHYKTLFELGIDAETDYPDVDFTAMSNYNAFISAGWQIEDINAGE